MTRSWHEVWERRQLDPERPTLLARLMAADGLDSGFGDVDERPWLDFVERVAARLGIVSGSSVFEVGCGAGAFLLPLAERGCEVAGLDASSTLLAHARASLPGGHFVHGEAAELGPSLPAPRYDYVISCGVFLYFPSLEYARAVIERMARIARRGVAILDVPDVARRAAAEEYRRGRLGEAEYQAKYGGLDHLYFDRAFIAETLLASDLDAVETEDQSIAGYGNAAFRFNAFARARERA